MRPSARLICTVPLLAPATTWLFVSRCPAVSSTKPEPCASPMTVLTSIATTDSLTAAATFSQSGLVAVELVTGPLAKGVVFCRVTVVETVRVPPRSKTLKAPAVPALARIAAPAAAATTGFQIERGRSGRTGPASAGAGGIPGGVGTNDSGGGPAWAGPNQSGGPAGMGSGAGPVVSVGAGAAGDGACHAPAEKLTSGTGASVGTVGSVFTVSSHR